MSLKDWLLNGWLVEHKTSPQEIAELLDIADRDLIDCQLPGLSPDRKLSTAYNATLQIAKAALAVIGFRAGREAHHFWTLQSLEFTVGYDKKLLEKLDGFRKKRNISDYERAGAVSDKEADEMFELMKKLTNDFKIWLRNNYPELLTL